MRFLPAIWRLGLSAVVAAACFMPPPSARAYEEREVPNGGAIVGSVRAVGEIVPLPPQPVWKHAKECGTTVPDERLVTDQSGGLGNVVVTLVGIEHGKALARGAVTLENRRCMFVPHVLTACVGQTLDVVNRDPFLHDAHAWLGNRTLFNLAIPRGRTVHTILRDAGLIHINCNVRHTWMHAYLFVADHPYHTVTDAHGRFAIAGIPPGTHRLRVWHEVLGSADRDVLVSPGATTQVDIELAATAPAGPPPDTP